MSRYRSRSHAIAPRMQLANGPRAPMRSPVEPVEIDDPMNRALDQIEGLVREVIADGGEAALLARLERLLPSAARAKGDR